MGKATELRSIMLEALEQAPDAILICNESGTIEYANKHIASILGYLGSELVGCVVDELVPDAYREGHDRLRHRYGANPTLRPMGIGRQLSARHRDGREVPVEISLSPVVGEPQGRVIAVIRDVSERRKLLDHIASQRDHLMLVVGALRDGLVEIDPVDSSYISINDRFCDMVGYTREEVLQTKVAAPWFVDASVEAFLEIVLREGSHARDNELTHRSGAVVPVTMSGSRVFSAGGRPTVVVLVHNLADEREAAAIVAQAQAQLAIADDRDRIARDLHDTVIQRLFATGLMLQASTGRADIDDRIDRAVTSIDDAIRELRTSIFTLRRPSFALAVGDSIRTTAEEARQMLDCPLLVQVANDVDYRVPSTMRDELVAIVRESLTNVVKHAAARSVGLHVDVEEDYVVVRVTDDGVGFSDERVTGGYGLRNLRSRVEALGGRCEITTSPGTGSKLVFALPLPVASSVQSDTDNSIHRLISD